VRRPRGDGERLAEEAAQEFLHLLVAGRALPQLDLFGGADVDDRRADLLDQVGEVRQAGDDRRADLGGGQRGRGGQQAGHGKHQSWNGKADGNE
jgi:hypothetical protein